MKKILFSILAMLMMTFTIADAQTLAYKNASVTDNTYVGVGVGATAPLDFNAVLPLNTTFDVRLGKELTPVTSFELEGTALFGDNHFGDYKTFVKGTNLGLNALFNVGNLFGSYKLRAMEYKAVVGLGWLHIFDNGLDALTAKTAADIVLNIGEDQKFAVVFEPVVYWDLNKKLDTRWHNSNIKFSKNRAQAGLNVNFVYRFKNSGNARRIVAYDIDALYAEIETLRNNVTTVHDTIVKEVVRERQVVTTPNVTLETPVYVCFSQDSYVLTDDAKKVLDHIAETVNAGDGLTVDGYASPEGDSNYNLTLSTQRANAVAEYLKTRGVIIKDVNGRGVAYGQATNRVVTVTK